MMKKLLLLSTTVCMLAFNGMAQNLSVTAHKLSEKPARSFTSAQSNPAAMTALVSDTLHYFFNKNYYRNTTTTNLQFWTIKSPLASNQNVTHCGAVFLNSSNTTVHGLEGLVMRSPASSNPTIGVTLYLCNVNASNIPQFPPLDSVVTSVSTSTAGVWVGGNFTSPVSVPGKFAVLFKRTFNQGDTAVLFMNNAATSTSTYAATQKYGEGLGVLRLNGNFQITTNTFGTGTDYEFIVAPRVSYSYDALVTTLTPTVCTNSSGSFSNVSTPVGIIEHRQFNFNKFAAHWKAIAPGTNTLISLAAPDSIYNWTFTGSATNSTTVKNPSVVFNTAGNQSANLTVKYKQSANVGQLASINDIAAASISVAPASGPAITVTGNTMICSGSTATLTANGSPTYTWSNNSNASSIVVTPTTNTSYTVNAGSGGGCVSSETVMVSVAQVPTLAISGATGACAGAAAVALSVSGAANYTWSTGSTANSISVSTGTPGTYSISVSGENAPCAPSSASKVITINALPVVSLAAEASTVCTKVTGGSTLVLTGSPAGGNYFGAGVSSGGIFTPNTAGNIVLTYAYTDASTGCSKTGSTSVQVVACTVNTTSIANNSLNANLVAYPNPSIKGIVSLKNLEGSNTILVYNMLGELLIKQTTEKPEFMLDLSGKADGNYFIKIKNAEGQSKVLKIVNQN